MASEAIEKFKTQWAEMDPKFRWVIGAILVGGAILVYVKGQEHDELVRQAEEKKAAQVTVANVNAQASQGITTSGMSMSAMPSTPRNQGLEDLLAELNKTRDDAKRSTDAATAATTIVQKMSDRVTQLENTRNGGVLARPDSVNLNDRLPPPVDFNQAPIGKAKNSFEKNLAAGSEPSFAGTEEKIGKDAAKSSMHVWADEPKVNDLKKQAGQAPNISIPANSALESVMLTGINARSNSSGNATSGSAVSANKIGSPFVTRLKGNAILPNGWKVAELGDCFVSGTGIAVLSSERANVISDRITCIDKKGVIFETPISAYGVDLDGIQGISGRVVTKQGSILAKTALAGIASGLGAALTPQAVPGYNSNQQSGDKQGIQYANPQLIAGTALGSGVSTAAAQLSKFYLDYAKEMFPVIEVNAGTRITWILYETVELGPRSNFEAK